MCSSDLATTEAKNRALAVAALRVVQEQQTILRANALDLAEARGLSDATYDRLKLDPKRVDAIAKGLRDVAALPDPVGEVMAEWTRPNGMKISRVRVPLGVVGVIYESRPNVTADAAALCLKSGNAVLLRGSSSALNSNAVLVDVMRAALAGTDVPVDAINLVPGTSHGQHISQVM